MLTVTIMNILKNGNGRISVYRDMAFYTAAPDGSQSISIWKVLGWVVVLDILFHASVMLGVILFALLCFLDLGGGSRTRDIKDVTPDVDTSCAI